jgi:hypothetical protein
MISVRLALDSRSNAKYEAVAFAHTGYFGQSDTQHPRAPQATDEKSLAPDGSLLSHKCSARTLPARITRQTDQTGVRWTKL